jgi:tellurite resistance protein TerB
MASDRNNCVLSGEIYDPHHCQQEAVNALLTAGACVAVADGRVTLSERDEAASFVERSRVAPRLTRDELVALFDQRARRLEEGDFADFVVAVLRPIAGLPVSFDLIRMAERVATADEQLHPREIQAIRLLHWIMTNLPAPKLVSAAGSANDAH